MMATITHPTNLILDELATLMDAHATSHSVLNGVDPVTGLVGRDVDMYVPDRADAFGVAVRMRDLLTQHGYVWVTLPHPIWGPRCVGVSGDMLDYVELHLFPRLALGPIDAGRLFPLLPERGALGFSYDPALMLFKQVIMKHNRAILRGSPIWTHSAPSRFLADRGAALGDRYQQVMPHGAEFVAALLSADTETRYDQRRRGLIRLLARGATRSTVSALRMMSASGSKRIVRFSAVSGPYLTVRNCRLPAPQLSDALQERVGRIFLSIHVTDRPLPPPARRWIQSRQGLIVQITDQDRSDLNHPGTVILGETSDPGAAVDAIARAALNEFVRLGQAHLPQYRKAMKCMIAES